MNGYRIIIPPEISQAIQKKYCGSIKRFSMPSFQKHLFRFFDRDLHKLNGELANYYAIKENRPSVDVLYRAFNRKKVYGVYCQDGERTLLDALCYYAFEERWSFILGRFAIDENSLINIKSDDESVIASDSKSGTNASTSSSHNLATVSTQQPPVSLFDDGMYATKILFKTRYISLIGRNSDIEQLKKFWCDELQFTWWLIIGSTGSGKSHLALSFCEELVQDGYTAGFLHQNIIQGFDWHKWEPENDVLLVFDDAGLYISLVISVITILQNRNKTFKHRVRILLLDRGEAGTSWQTLSRLLRLEQIWIWRDPWELKPLTEQDSVSVFNTVLKKEGTTPHLPDGYIIKLFENTDIERKPLFIILSALLVLNNNSVGSVSKSNLLQFSYDSMLDLSSSVCANTLIDKRTLDKHLVLVIIGTILNGVFEKDLKTILTDGNPWLPNLQDFSEDIYLLFGSIITAAQGKAYGFIEPSIFGGYFVLKQIASSENSMISNYGSEAIIDYVWDLSPKSVETFLCKTYEDLPKLEFTLLKFLSVSEGQYSTERKYCTCNTLVHFAWHSLHQNNTDKAKFWYLHLKSQLCLSDNENDVHLAFKCAYELFKRTSQNDITTLSFYYNEISQIGSAHQTLFILEKQMTALKSLVYKYTFWDIAVSERYLNQLKDLIKCIQSLSDNNTLNDAIDECEHHVSEARERKLDSDKLTLRLQELKVEGLHTYSEANILQQSRTLARLIDKSITQNDISLAVAHFKNLNLIYVGLTNRNHSISVDIAKSCGIICNEYLILNDKKNAELYYSFLETIANKDEFEMVIYHLALAQQSLLDFAFDKQDHVTVGTYFTKLKHLATYYAFSSIKPFYSGAIYKFIYSNHLHPEAAIRMVIDELEPFSKISNHNDVWMDLTSSLAIILGYYYSSASKEDLDLLYSMFSTLLERNADNPKWRAMMPIYLKDHEKIKKIREDSH